MYKAARQQTQCDVINDVKLFPTIYRRIYCRKFLSLSNQTSRYKSNGIRICIFFLSLFFLYILPDPLSSIIGRCTLYTRVAG